MEGREKSRLVSFPVKTGLPGKRGANEGFLMKIFGLGPEKKKEKRLAVGRGERFGGLEKRYPGKGGGT